MITIAAVIIAAAVTGILIGLRGNAPAPQAINYTNLSRNYRVCLLTTGHDTSTDAPLWQTIQNAAARSPINAQHITAPDGTPDQLQPYVNGLVAMDCQLIIAPGAELAGPARNAAKAAPHTHFLISVDQPNLTNTTTIPADPHTLLNVITNASQGLSTTNTGR
jgi:basic membrane lipoprotein Med (substrate-binding protein (PBP1-ABC) superfamily)